MGEQWPEWWHWELEITPHVVKRMTDREFTEVDLRAMLDDAVGYVADHQEGRWVIETRFQKVTWKVIVEPDREDRFLVVVTAFPE